MSLYVPQRFERQARALLEHLREVEQLAASADVLRARCDEGLATKREERQLVTVLHQIEASVAKYEGRLGRGIAVATICRTQVSMLRRLVGRRAAKKGRRARRR